ncbi:hypothetical protein FA15DRAFT_731083 [Coprinopsis marcescibilis]|uniref:Uncharacterized protein n=1 Tax=Coprinopsis marcescibilis TaxID=230819 RepID=A0A5C3L0V9_COPMA|nr:hypothetical protein FA15DRAFT_731083 [Coprinopsis marcescibilis]
MKHMERPRTSLHGTILHCSCVLSCRYGQSPAASLIHGRLAKQCMRLKLCIVGRAIYNYSPRLSLWHFLAQHSELLMATVRIWVTETALGRVTLRYANRFGSLASSFWRKTFYRAPQINFRLRQANGRSKNFGKDVEHRPGLQTASQPSARKACT